MIMHTLLFMVASIDGKVTTNPTSNPDYDWNYVNTHYLDVYYKEMFSTGADGVVMSAYSFVNFMDLNAKKPKEWNSQLEVSIFVVDSRGLLNEFGLKVLKNRYKKLIIFVSELTPKLYLGVLNELNIEYFKSGTEKVDYEKMFNHIASLGYKKISVESGGTLNSYLLRAKVIDEVQILTVPILVGGLGTPSIMDGPQLENWSGIIPMKLINVERLDPGFIKTTYKVLNDHTLVKTK